MLQPPLHFIVNVRKRHYGNSMRNAILLGKASGVDEAPRRLHILQREAQVDPRLSRRFDLSEHMRSIKRNDRLARAGLYVLADTKSQLEQRTLDQSGSLKAEL